MKLKASRQKEVINIRIEINETEKSMKQKLFFKNNNVDKVFSRLIRRKRKTQNNTKNWKDHHRYYTKGQ